MAGFKDGGELIVTDEVYTSDEVYPYLIYVIVPVYL
jgi:hypothetical protein